MSHLGIQLFSLGIVCSLIYVLLNFAAHDGGIQKARWMRLVKLSGKLDIDMRFKIF